MTTFRILPSNASPAARVAHWYQQYRELGKVRLSAMVVITTAVGFAMAETGNVHWATLFWTCLGTFLAAIGASALNQRMEIVRDGRMDRTKNRPLPGGHMSPNHATLFGVLAVAGGLAILCPLANYPTALLGLANVLIYVLLYTPLKPRTTLNTLVGAVVGGIPPMMGWTAAAGTLSTGGWLLGAILFVWQIPHFLALAWMYRDDYHKGGYLMLPGIDPSGTLTCRVIIAYSCALFPLCLALTWFNIAGWVFGGGSVVLGIWLLSLEIKLMRDKTRENAKRLFLASVVYLPALLLLMVADRGMPADLFGRLGLPGF
jgi:protoheme IX farnesyltransferase